MTAAIIIVTFILIFLAVFLVVFLSRHPFTMNGDWYEARIALSFSHAVLISLVISASVQISVYMLLFLLIYLIPYVNPRYILEPINKYIFQPIDKLDRFLHERKK